MITVDSVAYDINIISLQRKAEFLDKFAERTADGILHRELIGVYFNYSLTLSPGSDISEYAAFYLKITEAEEFHTVTLWDEDGEYTFTAYVSNISDEIRRIQGASVFWKNLTVNFIAKSPTRTPA
jgi:hypothetical protein